MRLFGESALPASRWTASLDKVASLSDRAAAHKASGGFVRAVQTWRAWDGEHRGVRFIDDDYAAAQMLLSMYERAAPAVDRAAEVARSLDSLGSFSQGEKT